MPLEVISGLEYHFPVLFWPFFLQTELFPVKMKHSILNKGPNPFDELKIHVKQQKIILRQIETVKVLLVLDSRWVMILTFVSGKKCF